MSACPPAVQDLDFSNMPYPGTVKSFPAWEKALKILLGVLVSLTAVVGNILVIVIVAKFKSMHTTTNYYLVNLAISDLLVAIIPIWIHVIQSMNEFWLFGWFLCKFNPFLQITAMCASMFTLAVISGDRFFAIIFPMKSRVTRRRVSWVLIILWVASISIATPLLFMYFYEERMWLDVHEMYCDEKWPMIKLDDGSCDFGTTSKKAYWIIVCVVLNWTPMIFMMISYTFIVIKLRKHKIVPKLGASSKSTVQQKSKRRVVVMLLSVFILFIVCAVPFQCQRIYFLFTQDDTGYKLPGWYSTLDFATVLLLYSNSAINPIIYGGLNESFRKGFKDLVNGVINRNSPTASEEFETEFKSRVTMRSRLSDTSDKALVARGRSSLRLAIVNDAFKGAHETVHEDPEKEVSNVESVSEKEISTIDSVSGGNVVNGGPAVTVAVIAKPKEENSDASVLHSTNPNKTESPNNDTTGVSSPKNSLYIVKL